IRDLRLALRGRFQVDNAVVALAALEAAGWIEAASDEAVRQALAGVRWPGRIEILRERPRVIVDGAHNPAGMAALAAEIPLLAQGRPVRLLFGVLSDKRWRDMVGTIAPLVAEALVVPVPERRSEDPDRVAAEFRRFVPTRTAPSGEVAFAELLARGSAESDCLLVAGSLFLVGEVRRATLQPNVGEVRRA
ncbi:MAG: glutamate ligase domain-containing protein, partial [Candidatus Binatia bacterium]